MAARAAVLAALVAAFVVGCQSGSPAPMPTPPAGAVVVTVDQTRFMEASVEAPAGVPFTLFFENRESAPHNVHVIDGSGATVVQTEIVSGPTAQADDVPALRSGTYALLCDVHPDMRAQLMVN